MDRDKTRRALKEAMSKIGNRPKRKVSGMSPGKRRAITGSATGKTTREKLMAAFKKAQEKRTKDRRTPTGGLKAMPAIRRMKQKADMAKMGPAGARKMMGAAPMAGAGVGALSKAVTGLAKQISGKKGKPTSADISKARSFLKQAMTAAGKGK